MPVFNLRITLKIAKLVAFCEAFRRKRVPPD